MTGGNSPSSRKYSPLDLSEKEKENPFHEESEIHLKSTEEYDQQVIFKLFCSLVFFKLCLLRVSFFLC